MGGSSPKPDANTQTTTITEPPAYVKPYAEELMSRAGSLSKRPYEAYTGEQVAPLNQNHDYGLDMVQDRALNGSDQLNQANAQASGTLSGSYQGYAPRNEMAGVNNPYLNDMIRNSNADITRSFTNSTMPQTDASFARQGAFGGSAWQDANSENNRQMASELAKNTSNIRFNDYQNQQGLAENYAQRQQAGYEGERGRQVGMVGQAQQLANQPYTDAMQLLGAGDIQRDYSQTLNNQGYQDFLNEQNWPLQNLDVLANAIRTTMGSGGSSVTSQAMPEVNSTAGMIGGGLAGAALGNSLGSGSGYEGLATAAGGLLGGAGGYFA